MYNQRCPGELPDVASLFFFTFILYPSRYATAKCIVSLRKGTTHVYRYNIYIEINITVFLVQVHGRTKLQIGASRRPIGQQRLWDCNEKK